MSPGLRRAALPENARASEGSFALLRRFAHDGRGATAIEYALIAAGVSVAVVGTVMSLGSAVQTNLYDRLAAMF